MAGTRLDELPDLLTVEEFRGWARIGRRQAYEAIAAGDVPHLRLGGKTIRIPKHALRAWLEPPSGPGDDDGPAQGTTGPSVMALPRPGDGQRGPDAA